MAASGGWPIEAGTMSGDLGRVCFVPTSAALASGRALSTTDDRHRAGHRGIHAHQHGRQDLSLPKLDSQARTVDG